jgi:hypothetical protein
MLLYMAWIAWMVIVVICAWFDYNKMNQFYTNAHVCQVKGTYNLAISWVETIIYCLPLFVIINLCDDSQFVNLAIDQQEE